jgi:serine-type D-Ala-D-Ala carboxypeptidase (penicillin-binding protein 5/6)
MLKVKILQKLITYVAVFTLFIALTPNTSLAKTPYTAAQTAILMEQDSGRVLYEKRMHQKMRIASITKIMTAILAIESGKFEEDVTVSKRAVYTEGSSIYLKEGEKIKLKHLTYGLMLRSGNDAAVAIAEHVGGSVEGFVYLMNEKAQEIGMRNTYFSNPHGLDDHEEHYSTAYDMALLTQYAMQNELYRKVSSTKKYRAPREGAADNIWGNKNRLLTGIYEYCTGGKTGYTKRAKRTLVTTAEKDEMKLIVVTLNDGNDWNDHKHLYEWGFTTYDNVQIVQSGIVKGIDDDFYKDHVKVENAFTYPLTKAERDQIHKELNLYKPDMKKWKRTGIPSPVGFIKIYLQDEHIGNVSLFYEAVESSGQPFTEPSFFNLFMNVFSKIIGVANRG